MKYGENTSVAIEQTATQIVEACYRVHRVIGPGLLESVYQACLEHELSKRGCEVASQTKIPLFYDGTELKLDFRLDLIINNNVIIEVKSVEKMHPIFEAQALTYLKLTGKRLCFLVNFNVSLIKDGIKRIVL